MRVYHLSSPVIGTPDARFYWTALKRTHVARVMHCHLGCRNATKLEISPHGASVGENSVLVEGSYSTECIESTARSDMSVNPSRHWGAGTLRRTMIGCFNKRKTPLTVS